MTKDEDYIKYEVLKKLHEDNEWSEELLGGLFSNVHDYILTPKERMILQMKVDGKINGEIAIALGCQVSTIKRDIRYIKKKLRLGESSRIDHHPEIRKQKGFTVRKQRYT